MTFRLRADMIFEKRAAAEQAFKAATEFMPDTTVINKGKPNEEDSRLELEACGHETGEACKLLMHWTSEMSAEKEA